MPELAYVNGTVGPIGEALVPIEDRGYQFGDAVYEFIASYNGKLFALGAHLDRLDNSLRGLDFPHLERNGLATAIEGTFAQAGLARAGVYVQISRGVAPRNHAFPAEARPQVVVTVRPAPEIPEAVRRQGARAITVTDIRWGRCDLKTVQLLPNVLAKQQALAAGVNDAIFVGADGVVREGSSSNVFIAKGGALHTHPLTPQILPGITRQVLLEICREERLDVHEAFFHKEQLYAADEVFLSGTVTEVLPVVRIDGRTIGDGRPGPLANRLFEQLRRRMGA